MTEESLTDELALRALGWRKAPGRYLKAGRSWISDSRFQPLKNVEDAFRLLDAVADAYSLISAPGPVYTVHLTAEGRTGSATGKSKARTICFAVARLLNLAGYRE